MRSVLFGLLACFGSLLSAAGAGAGEHEYTYPLFDGESLAGWTVENDCEVGVADGMIRLKAGNGWLRSHRTFGDFKLHVEWKALKKADYDAGIYVRTANGGKPFPKNGYQLNLLEGKVGVIGNVDGAVPPKGLVKPAGQWNTFDVTVVGETVALEINGKPAYKVGGLEAARGHVGLQVEVPKGGQFLVKNVRLTELGYRSLLNGKDLTDWEGAGGPAEKCWAVEDGVLVGLKKKGPWLRSKEQFGDFNFRLQYRVDPGANSGIYVRVPANGKHHRDNDKQPPAGFEVQILDDSAKKYANLKDYQFCGSVYDIAGAREHVGRKPGEWNTLEIDCRGHRVTTIHNGVTIVEVTPEEHPKITLRKLEGYLGFQNHGGGVAYRNLRIGPSVIEPDDGGTGAQ